MVKPCEGNLGLTKQRYYPVTTLEMILQVPFPTSKSRYKTGPIGVDSQKFHQQTLLKPRDAKSDSGSQTW